MDDAGDDAHHSAPIETIPSLSSVDRAAWDAIANPPGLAYDPFLSWDFLQALEESGCVGRGTGWSPRHLIARQGDGLVAAMPLYRKDHSYGEYVFDHAWADALHRAGGRYYPKLQGAVPFTPVTGRRLLGAAPLRAALLRAAIAETEAAQASSLHLTFLTEAEAGVGQAAGLLRRTGVQFHWDNAGYANFQDFLAALSSAKRKTIRRERERAQASAVIETYEGDAITPAVMDHVFACYQDTGARKWGSPYLNRAAFDLFAARMADRMVVFVARVDSRPVAMALNFRGGDCLYGRYWGRLADIDFLHFELCYYQAMDYAIAHGLARVEAGAQGEHKLLRGYAPRATHSLHWLAHPGLRAAVGDFLARETPAIVQEIEWLDAHTPFRATPPTGQND